MPRGQFAEHGTKIRRQVEIALFVVLLAFPAWPRRAPRQDDSLADMANQKEMSFSGEDITPDRLNALVSNPDLEKLVIWGGDVTNDQFEPLSRLAHLKGLVLGEMSIDDGVFQHIRALQDLAYLNLAYTNVEGDFTELAKLPLQDLRLEGCRRVGDRCARSLAAFPNLRQLEIHMTGLTDDGVHHLASLPLEFCGSDGQSRIAG
jgi:hypothetical protein